mgnify:CR=1 FL=1
MEGKGAEEYREEVVVVAKLFKHIEIFSSNLSAVDVVENLKEHESVENNS